MDHVFLNATVNKCAYYKSGTEYSNVWILQSDKTESARDVTSQLGLTPLVECLVLSLKSS